MTTATKLREIEDGRQAEYRLDPPVTLNVWGETMEITHLISSHSVLTGIVDDVTMLLPSDGNGNVVRYTDFHYMPGHVDHDEAVRNFLEENYHE